MAAAAFGLRPLPQPGYSARRALNGFVTAGEPIPSTSSGQALSAVEGPGLKLISPVGSGVKKEIPTPAKEAGTGHPPVDFSEMSGRGVGHPPVAVHRNGLGE